MQFLEIISINFKNYKKFSFNVKFNSKGYNIMFSFPGLIPIGDRTYYPTLKESILASLNVALEDRLKMLQKMLEVPNLTQSIIDDRKEIISLIETCIKDINEYL